MARTDTKYFPLGGGLDVVTPALSVPPGRLLTCVNYEPWFSGGYRRIDGFERFDGRPAPHSQTFTGFDVSAVEDVVLGSTVTGGTSGATGVVIGKYVDDGTYGSDVLAVTKVVGDFVDDETLDASSTGAIALRKPNAAITDSGSNLLSGAYTDIDEGVDFAESATGLYTNEQTPALRSVAGEWSAGTVEIPLLDIDAAATAVTAWTMSVRARVLRRGPETDDTVTYRFTFAPGADSQVIDFTEGDAGAGWITRTVTQAVSASSVANFNAENISLAQQAFTLNGYGDDELSIEVDCVQVEATFNAPVTIRSAPQQGYAPNQDVEDEFKEATFTEYREDIAVVPGTGPVRGAWRRNADTFAIRDQDVGEGTIGVLHLASSAGWTTTGITMAHYVYYESGTDGAVPTFILEGDTVTGQTSAASAVVHRIVLQAGAPGTNDAVGYIVFAAITGGPFQNGENLRIGGLTVAVAYGPSAEFALPNGGVYRFINHNFFGSSNTYNVYACNGVGPAFEISEDNVVSPILFPAVALNEQPQVNTPFLIEEFQNFLFFAMPGGRIVQTVNGLPLSFNGFLGAAEFGIGAEITGLNSVTGGVLVITTQSQTRGLSGFYPDWVLKIVGEKTGGALYSTQLLDTVYGLDDLGITSIARIQSFGDFAGSTISQLVQPIVDSLRSRLTDATVVRKYNQYRVYFDGNEILIMYVPTPGANNTNLSSSDSSGAQFGFASYPFPVAHIWNTDDETGAERTFFATSESDGDAYGYVYEDLVGTSFDGEIIRSYIRLPFNFLNSAALRKHFRRADIELSSLKPLELKFVADLTYGSPEVSSGISDLTSMDIPQIEVFAGGGFWDTDNWDDFFWDGQNLSAARADLNGTGENIGFLIYNESTVTTPYILQGMTLHYDRRRLQR